MRKALILLFVLAVVACSAVSRPDIGKVPAKAYTGLCSLNLDKWV